ncbi:MAG: type II CAAX prenyl endopeptidase Rce1 family protein [bacterium]
MICLKNIKKRKIISGFLNSLLTTSFIFWVLSWLLFNYFLEGQVTDLVMIFLLFASNILFISWFIIIIKNNYINFNKYISYLFVFIVSIVLSRWHIFSAVEYKQKKIEYLFRIHFWLILFAFIILLILLWKRHYKKIVVYIKRNLQRVDDIIKKTHIEKRLSFKKSILFITLMPISYFLVSYNFSTNGYLNQIISYALLILICLIFGQKEIKDYINKIESWKKTISISFLLLIVMGIFAAVGVVFIGNVRDPQGIMDVQITIVELLQVLSILPGVAIGEELLKVLIFLGFISIFKLKWRARVFLAVIISSFFFGYLHVVHYPFTAMIPIAVGSIPSFLFLLYYKSIIPLILAHFLWDTLSFMMRINSYLTIIVLIVYSIFSFCFLNGQK